MESKIKKNDVVFFVRDIFVVVDIDGSRINLDGYGWVNEKDVDRIVTFTSSDNMTIRRRASKVKSRGYIIVDRKRFYRTED